MTTVSVLCVTFNRQHLIPFIIYQFKKQTYPNHLMELIIYDDSKNETFPGICDDNIRYIYDNQRRPLGEKRNKLNALAKGDIIVWFDDDDYYFPERISKTVSALNSSSLEIVGCKYTLLYDSSQSKRIFKITHQHNYTQNNIMAYKKQYLKKHKYCDSDNYDEEKYFTNNYSPNTIMMNGIDLCIHIAHKKNTITKSRFFKRKNLIKLNFNEIVKDKYIINTIDHMNTKMYESVKAVVLSETKTDTDTDTDVAYDQHKMTNIEYIHEPLSLKHHLFYNQFYNSQFDYMIKVYNHLSSLQRIINTTEPIYINTSYYDKKYIVICERNIGIPPNIDNIVTNAPQSWELLQLCANNEPVTTVSTQSYWINKVDSNLLSMYVISYDCIDKLIMKCTEYDYEKNNMSLSFECCEFPKIFDDLNVYRLNNAVC